MKIYCVKKGRNPGIYNTWNECEQQIKGFNGALYKAFNSYDDALNYFNIQNIIEWNFDKNATIFVDGGFNKITKPNAYGSVTNFSGQDLIIYNKNLLTDMTIINVNLPVGNRDVIVSFFEGVTQQNNGAELLAAIAGFRIALHYIKNGIIVKHIASDSKLIVEFWSKKIKTESESTFCQKKVSYIKELIYLRQQFESYGGTFEKIDADGPLGNPADLGYHK